MKKIAICSGYFNPIHKGHVDYLTQARKLADKLFVIVNNDLQVEIKGSVPFMDEEERLYIVKSLKPVDSAIVSLDKDSSVCETITSIHNLYSTLNLTGDILGTGVSYKLIFTNGGDRKSEEIPEYEVCQSLGIEMVFNVGGGKTQSSSDLLKGVNQ